ncbi:MAG: transcriptional regulator [Paenibacillus macerans]|uniref:transcriptional regulator n=1 Tax=Paenibacillus macerans TaxID=44252 RepID=UPI001F115171|nr:transcriptional regulator [Paenibacillus macerans]MDU5945453.1 transcriptional regulator [Paenibacillus macerans]MDU7473616.1 transcriptional regulator [Paenibacillus macerans]MEC0139200.1 transcriptional regulator [Paenibacillus macerans]UMV47281.1 transcriptional regulator [Paenibacillus macerans]
MAKAKNKLILLPASITGEMKPQDIPHAPGVDLEAIKSGDEDPLEVVVEVPAGKSTRGWNYTPESLKSIVDHVNRDTLSGFLGHQKPEEVGNKFDAPVTHWVGARMEGTRAYFRGVVDAAAKDLKRWIRSGRIKQVSIFGMPKLQTVAGETQVIDYKPLSIDWTPLDRSGMPTRIVALGEMDEFDEGGNETMDWKELLAQLKAKIAAGETTLQEVIAALDADTATKLELLAKVKQALGVTEDDKLLTSVEQAGKALKESRQAELGQEVKEAVREKVSGEMAQNLIAKMITPKEGQTKETIVGEIDSLLADESIKAMINRMSIDTPAFIGGSAIDNRTPSGNATIQTDSVPI